MCLLCLNLGIAKNNGNINKSWKMHVGLHFVDLRKAIKFPLYLLKCANLHDCLANDSSVYLNERILKIQLNCKRWVHNKSSKVRGYLLLSSLVISPMWWNGKLHCSLVLRTMPVSCLKTKSVLPLEWSANNSVQLWMPASWVG
jgi:hypothetical protein